ncbi:hypothetical protein EV138_6309 [Kribbella voronezhensis]|uniref:Uncharacterized protein n=2 Tax=Kribbella voronezhensis TaxID=2512212 RepID=A0A4R7SXU4_9ACTN|nr:hypothetical protein EV138_6309 [Kribbella voronezhensis]
MAGRKPRARGGAPPGYRMRHDERWAAVTNQYGVPPPPRSALTLRLILATFGLLVCAAAAIVFALLDLPLPLILVAALLAVVAAVDLVVITRRKLHGEPG